MKNLLIIILTVTGIRSYAQSSIYNLEKCLEYGLKNHSNVKNADLNIESAKSKVKETSAVALPQIDGKISINNNVKIQNQFLPANVFSPQAPEGLVQPVAFGIQYGSNVYGSLSQLIFDGSYLVGVKAAKAYSDLAIKEKEVTLDDIAANIHLAYYAVLINKEQITLLEENIDNLEKITNETEVLVKNGLVETIEVKRLKVSLINLKIDKSKAKRMLGVSIATLKFQMGMSLEEELIIDDNLKNYLNTKFDLSELEVNYNERSDYRMLQTQKFLYELDLKNKKAAMLPKIYGFGQYGANTGQYKFNEMTKLNNYRDYAVVGVQLDVPIFKGGQIRQQQKQAVIEVEKAKNSLEQMERAINLESNQHYQHYLNAIDVLSTHEESIELAREVSRISQIKYKEGLASNLELIEAENSLKQAVLAKNSAVYEVLASKTNLEKALGTLRK